MTVPLPGMADGDRRLLIIRGDLCSRTGVAYAARAQLRLLESNFDIAGVDVHPDPKDLDGYFPYPIIREEEIPRQIATRQRRPVVLHHTPPDDFRSFAGAWNIGSFFWETDVAPRLRQWAIKIALMDAMWAPCSMIAALIQDMGYTGPIHSITWPFDFAQPRRSEQKLRQSINVRHFRRRDAQGFEVRDTPLAVARSEARNLFVTVQSLAARKGLPILLREWQIHLSEAANANDLLILRLAFRHRPNFSGAPEEHFASMLQDAGFPLRQDARIGIIADTLSDAELTELFQTSDAYVSTSFGEGFGGPIIEAIVNDRPVIVPRHTAMCDYIAPDYPLIVASERRVIGLRGGLSVYPPAAAWHVPSPNAAAAQLATFARMSAAERTKLAFGLRNRAAAFCAVPVVRHAMLVFLRALFAGSSPETRHL